MYYCASQNCPGRSYKASDHPHDGICSLNGVDTDEALALVAMYFGAGVPAPQRLLTWGLVNQQSLVITDTGRRVVRRWLRFNWDPTRVEESRLGILDERKAGA